MRQVESTINQKSLNQKAGQSNPTSALGKGRQEAPQISSSSASQRMFCVGGEWRGVYIVFSTQPWIDMAAFPSCWFLRFPLSSFVDYLFFFGRLACPFPRSLQGAFVFVEPAWIFSVDKVLVH